MKRAPLTPLLIWALSLLPAAAGAHFQELIPSSDMVGEQTRGQILLELQFTHPMNRGPLMPMGEPVEFGVMTPEGRVDLKPSLIPLGDGEQFSYRARYRFNQPGDHIFYLQPSPYWEASEGRMIVHYTKVVVNAFEKTEGWERLVGFPVEIEPLVRPYGLWSGNLFRGIVRHDGRPVPFARLEVEWRNDGSLDSGTLPLSNQVIRTDANGVFSYAMVRPGWWGFAALPETGQTMSGPQGLEVPLEQGGVIWVHNQPMEHRP